MARYEQGETEPIGREESIRLNIKGSQPTDTNLRKTLNSAESAEAAIRHYTNAHPVETHFSASPAKQSWGRRITKDLAKQLGIGEE